MSRSFNRDSFARTAAPSTGSSTDAKSNKTNASNIRSDPKREGDPEHIVQLVGQVVRRELGDGEGLSNNCQIGMQNRKNVAE